MPPLKSSMPSSCLAQHLVWRRRRQLLLPLLLLSIAGNNVHGSPVSSPEIASKSAKAGISSVGGGNSQDAQLNSLSAYATNYDSITTAHAGAQGNSFKPSYKIPDMETNFTPIQSISSPAFGNATPVLMQVLPQTVHEGGMQYLQLIPTRPLIVPISPFLSGGAQVQAQAPQITMSYQQAPLAADNGIVDYSPRGAPLLTAVPNNNPMPQAAALAPLMDISSSLPYGLQTYANTITPYRTNYRINREVKGKNFPGMLSLNMNEYIPGPHDTPQSAYIRGRP